MACRAILSQKTEGGIQLFGKKKAFLQGTLLLAGMVMLCFGVMRGEVDTVFSKAVRLCLECVGIG